MPPPDAAEVAEPQLLPLEPDDEPEEHPAPSAASAAASPITANRRGDLTRMPPVGFPISIAAAKGRAA